ncbi:MAG: NifB/NifX family molybdenum-iron cluster-binding protein [candidate division Zixibacteria bacterium]|nr:NifB/NifX family molybdenum-iron cluster-binding protein [candidate division Zixibacteria bacterium]
MLACIPTNGNKGAEDTVCDHFGSAACFTLYDATNDTIGIVENRNAHHSHGTCHPMNQLAGYDIDCVVCSGIGRRAILALRGEGIKVYHSNSKKVKEVIAKIRANELTEVDPARACMGHGQQGSFIHDHSLGDDAARNGHGQGHGPAQHRGRGRGPGHGRGPYQ